MSNSESISFEDTHSWTVDPGVSDPHGFYREFVCNECGCQKYRYDKAEKWLYRSSRGVYIASLKTCDEEKIRSVLNE